VRSSRGSSCGPISVAFKVTAAAAAASNAASASVNTKAKASKRSTPHSTTTTP
jgi:hypothetical protein